MYRSTERTAATGPSGPREMSALSEPAVNRSEQFARLLRPAFSPRRVPELPELQNQLKSDVK